MPESGEQKIPAATGWWALNWVAALQPLADLVSANSHSRDFTSTRAWLISERIAPLALLLAICLPLWIPLEFHLTETTSFALLATLRVAAASAALALYLMLRRARNAPPTPRTRWHAPLTILLLIPAVLYAGARLFGGMDDVQLVTTGYAFFPLIAAMVFAIFPLTLRELGAAFALILLVFLAIEAMAVSGLAPLTLQLLWIILIAAAISAWASANHLRTLLQLYRQATRDLLTGLLNRRALTEQLERELQRAERYGRPLTLLMMDLDRFKRLNDEYGHLAGDQVLREFAQRAAGVLRDSDVLGRWGGEEFMGGLVETRPEGAQRVAERIRQACADKPVRTDDGRDIQFTVSIGVSPIHGGEALEHAVKRVDDALYAAKAAGRNHVTTVD